jgi:hypothetical protein
MKMKLFLFCALALLATAAHADRKIYSCRDAAGNAVFSPQPCGADSKEVAIDAGHAGNDTQPQSSDAINAISDGVADSDCRREAKKNSVYSNDATIQDLERRKKNLADQASYANNNLAGATYESGIRQQIGDLDIAISQERTRISAENAKVDSDYRAAVAECDRFKAERNQQRSNGN